MLAIARSTGRVRWITQLERWRNPDNETGPVFWTGPVLASNRLWIASSRGEVQSVDVATGEATSFTKLSDPVSLPPVVAGGMLYILDDGADHSLELDCLPRGSDRPDFAALTSSARPASMSAMPSPPPVGSDYPRGRDWQGWRRVRVDGLDGCGAAGSGARAAGSAKCFGPQLGLRPWFPGSRWPLVGAVDKVHLRHRRDRWARRALGRCATSRYKLTVGAHWLGSARYELGRGWDGQYWFAMRCWRGRGPCCVQWPTCCGRSLSEERAIRHGTRGDVNGRACWEREAVRARAGLDHQGVFGAS